MVKKLSPGCPRFEIWVPGDWVRSCSCPRSCQPAVRKHFGRKVTGFHKLDQTTNQPQKTKTFIEIGYNKLSSLIVLCLLPFFISVWDTYIQFLLVLDLSHTFFLHHLVKDLSRSSPIFFRYQNQWYWRTLKVIYLIGHSFGMSSVNSTSYHIRSLLLHRPASVNSNTST